MTTPDPIALPEVPVAFPMFVVYTNTDLTEGRGYQYPIAWAEVRTTAIRQAHKKGVMGSDAEVREVTGFRVGRNTYGPVRLEAPSADDAAKEAVNKARREAIERAKTAGLSDEDVAAIMGVKQ